MKIAIFMNTPAQVHFYKNIALGLSNEGHEVYLLARNYGETINVLKELGIDHYVYSNPPKSKYGKILSLPLDVLRAFCYLKNLHIDLITGFGVYDAYASFILRVPVVVFNDSEPKINTSSYGIQFKLFMPFVDTLITPASFMQNLGKKHIRINSYKELAYLHPDYFKPNQDIFNYLNIKPGEDYVLLRFNAFDAVHDLNIKGFNNDDKLRLVEVLGKYAKLFISTEAEVPKSMEKFIIKIPKSKIHDAIYYAKLFITDTQTMATESAILGVPTIRCNTFVGTNDMGNFLELETGYNLLFNFNNSQEAINKALELIQNSDLKEEWQKKRRRFLSEKEDIRKFMMHFLENYPDSLKEYHH